MRRRTFVLTAVSASTLGFAGCSSGDSGDGQSDSEGGTTDGGTSDDDSGSDGSGSDDGTTDGGTSDDDSGSDDSGSGDETTDGETTDGGGSNDGSGSDDSGSDESGSNGGSDDNSMTADGPAVGEHTQWTNSFIADMSFEAGGAVGTMTIRSNGGNYYQTMETEQGTMEIYQVDGDVYFVQGDQCFVNPGDMIPDPDTGVDPQDESAVTGSDQDLTPSGLDTIDGEEMYVYHTNMEGANATIYISAETGYMRRVETPQATIEYHSWGEVGAIETPDLDCRSM